MGKLPTTWWVPRLLLGGLILGGLLLGQLLGGLDDGVGNSPKRWLAGWAGAYHKSDYDDDDDQYDDYND